MLYYLTAVVFGMVGLTYAAVPLYRTFCQATGYGGTIQRKETVEEKIARHSESGTVTEREIVVQLNADVADGMQWKFTPTPREVRVKPGETALAFYTAENKSSSPITGVSTYNVTPMKAGVVYFNKIQCFCFEEQRLLPGEQIDMPVFFRTLIQRLKPIQEWTESITYIILCLTLSLKCPRKLVQIRTTITYTIVAKEST